jgi:hypothetical protein
MNPSMLFRISAVGLILVGATGGAVVACSSSTPAQITPPTDSGTPTDTSTGKDSGKPTKDGGVKPSDSGLPEASDSGTGLADVGSCVSDSSLCNSCYSFPDAVDAEVPFNACSSAVGNCVKFTGSVPDGAP